MNQQHSGYPTIWQYYEHDLVDQIRRAFLVQTALKQVEDLYLSRLAPLQVSEHTWPEQGYGPG